MEKKAYAISLTLVLSIIIYSAFASAAPWTVSGIIQNSSMAVVGNANVSIATFYPPDSTVYINSTLTADDGSFVLTSANDSATTLFKIRVLLRQNSTGGYFRTGNVTEMGPYLPAMPKQAMTGFMNGSTIYTDLAATLLINTTFSNGSRSDFNYMLTDNTLGSEIEMKINTLEQSNILETYVPRNRTYSLVLMKSPSAILAKGAQAVELPVPPLVFTINNLTSYADWSYQRRITLNLSYGDYSWSGYVFVAGNNTQDRMINFTKATVRLSAGNFVPESAILSFGTINITSQNSSVVGVNMPDGAIGFFSLPVLGSSSGITQVVQFFGQNQTFCNETAGGNCYFGQIQNITITTSNVTKNITLYPLIGAYDATAGTKVKKFYSYNGVNAGSSISDAMLEVAIKNSTTFGTLKFMVESISSGYFSLFMPSSVASATVKIYSHNFAPTERPVPVNASIMNITMKGANMEMRRAGGSETVTMDASAFNMRFLRHNNSCNTPFANFNSCILGGKGGDSVNGNFNPLSLMMSGKMNLLIQLNGSTSSMLFVGVDKLSSAPPTNSVIGNQSTGSNSTGNTLGEVWDIGSMAPPVYDRVYVTIPYNDSVDETQPISITLNTLYDNDWASVWNTTANPSGTNVPDAYSDFNNSWLNKTAGGMPCINTSTTANCYINYTANIIILNLPHFSNAGANIGGTRLVASAAAAVLSSGNAEGTSSSTVSIGEKKANWYSIEPGSPVSLEITDEAFEIRKVDIAVNEKASEPKITVSRLTDKPSSLPAPSATSYRYLEIKADNLADSKIEEAKIKFRVARLWLKEKSFDKGAVRLYRYKVGWNELSTRIVNDDDADYVYYEASTPGFSYFAIAATTAAPAPTNKPTSTVTEEAEKEVAPTGNVPEAMPEGKPAKNWVLWTAAGLLIAVALVVILLTMKRKRR